MNIIIDLKKYKKI